MCHAVKPFLMGVAMAALMLAMMHERIMSGTFEIGVSAILFVLVHVALVGLLFALSLLVPRWREVLRHHRPGFGHVAIMVLGMGLTGAMVHVAMHGWVI